MENNNELENNALDIEELNTDNNEEDTKIVWLSFFVFIIALVVIAFFSYKYYERYQLVENINQDNQNNQENQSSEIQNEPAKLQGKIYMTLSLKNDETGTTGVYAYNLKRKILEEIVINEGLQLLGGEIFHTGNRILTTNGSTIYINDMANLEKWGIILEDGVNNYKSFPVWSKRGWYSIFNARDDFSLDSNIPENWQIYSVHNDKTKKYLTSGIYPHISKDNNIVFLKNDGFYVIDLEGENETKFWEIEGQARANIQFDVSKTSDLMVFTNPYTESLYILRNRKEDYYFEGEIIKEIKAYAFQPTLSPDDEYLAIIELERKENCTFINPKLVIYDLETYERQEIMNLEEYDLESMLINDWR